MSEDKCSAPLEISPGEMPALFSSFSRLISEDECFCDAKMPVLYLTSYLTLPGISLFADLSLAFSKCMSFLLRWHRYNRVRISTVRDQICNVAGCVAKLESSFAECSSTV